MSVYLGTYGYVALKRSSPPRAVKVVLRAGDVNAGADRFALEGQENTFVTGDYIYIKNTANTDLDFVAASGWYDSQRHPDGNWYINVDEIGGIRLYDTYAKAITGNVAEAIDLTVPAADLTLDITVVNKDFLSLGQVTNYELSTQRETIDITALSDEFRSQLGALMSGSGSLQAHWNYQSAGEQSNYLLQLAIRTEIGSAFDARFYVKTANYTSGMGADETDDEIYYEVSGVITQAGIAFSPDSVVQVTADFVTTGPIRLKVRTLAFDELLQETGDRILQENSSAILLESSN